MPRSKGFAAATLLTLALGIGANTAVFSVVYGVLSYSVGSGGANSRCGQPLALRVAI